MVLLTIGCVQCNNNIASSQASSARLQDFQEYARRYVEHHKDRLVILLSPHDPGVTLHFTTGIVSDLETMGDVLRASKGTAGLPRNVRKRLAEPEFGKLPLLDRRHIVRTPEGWSYDNVFTLRISPVRDNDRRINNSSPYIFLMFGLTEGRWHVLSGCHCTADGSYSYSGLEDLGCASPTTLYNRDNS